MPVRCPAPKPLELSGPARIVMSFGAGCRREEVRLPLLETLRAAPYERHDCDPERTRGSRRAGTGREGPKAREDPGKRKRAARAVAQLVKHAFGPINALVGLRRSWAGGSRRTAGGSVPYGGRFMVVSFPRPESTRSTPHKRTRREGYVFARTNPATDVLEVQSREPNGPRGRCTKA
jgi:hypothetical protein